ncbi:hypothetical protein IV203_005272 [Nitzschia inconspicua]|uniref:Uncharacterized protein n=1 Tax=Nitzschia inconspicua TaxID=303405 RepID=A0A9K3KM33_9STRA|nr:hypothetical protein IV203_005272 [Nitzschia inconspicua]
MKKIASSTSQNANLVQYADAASSLFSNMITPASILCGAIIPLCFGSGIDYNGPASESKFEKFLRKIFPFVSTASMASLLVAITCSSVAVNQLTENKPAFAASVWDLLQRDYALAWAAVNSHFVFGMLGFMWLVGSKAYFMGGGPAAFGLALSGLTAMVSIVNRGVAIGGGKDSQRFGASIIGLVQSYLGLLWNHARHSCGPLEYVAVALFVGYVIGFSQHVLKQVFG